MIDERYELAQDVARRAGALALDYWRNRDRLTVELKGPQDFVSRADRDVEALIRRDIAAAFPDDRFLGEETAAAFTGPFDASWIVDPIDGTHNFLRGVPYWNVAIAYVEQGRPRIGVVYDPVNGELYRAERGGGAWRDDVSGGAKLHVAATSELAGAYVALGHHDRAPDCSCRSGTPSARCSSSRRRAATRRPSRRRRQPPRPRAWRARRGLRTRSSS